MERPLYDSSSGQRNSYKPRLRAPLTTLVTILFLALTFESTRSFTATTNPDLRPQSGDAAQTHDLERFLVAGSTVADHGFHAFRSSDLDAATRMEATPEPHRLSLLDSAPGIEEKRRFLHQMPYGTVIALAAERNHVDGLLLAAMVSVESGFSPKAKSPQGARGLMQVIPDVASDYGIKGDLFDPYVNMEVGSRFVGGLIKDYKGDLVRALAAYNAGPGVVERYNGVPPYSETRGYVRQVLAQYAEYHRKAGARSDFPFLPATAKASRSEAPRTEASGSPRSEISR
jgi:hypothetical protein